MSDQAEQDRIKAAWFFRLLELEIEKPIEEIPADAERVFDRIISREPFETTYQVKGFDDV